MGAARGKDLPKNYEQAREVLHKGGPRWGRRRGERRTRGNYQVGISNYDRGNDEERPVIGVWYHATEVVTFYPNGDVDFGMGGWSTVSTRNVINSIMRAHSGLVVGSSVYSDNEDRAYLKHVAMHPEDTAWSDSFPISARGRYRLPAGAEGEIHVFNGYGAGGEVWAPAHPLVRVPRARPLPKTRDTKLKPHLGDAFLHKETGNAYIWTTTCLSGCKGQPVFAVPYRREYNVNLPCAEVYARKPFYPLVLMGHDFDIWLLSENADKCEPIDRTKGGVYAHQG
jgi:hypothetical protein